MQTDSIKMRRALFTVSDKAGIVELAQALVKTGTEIVATGRTALVLKEAGITVTPIEKVSGSPEAFQGRMKTLSFPVCSGILYRRNDASDEADLKKLNIVPIDCVVVNFYPFEKTAEKTGITQKELIEEIDIGGPTLVRAAAKNAPDVLVLTSPAQYSAVINDLSKTAGVSKAVSNQCALEAWKKISDYDLAIESKLSGKMKKSLRYGENPHQSGYLEFDSASPIAWPETSEDNLTQAELSYNNILDLSAAYALACDLRSENSTAVVIVKHNNPCGVAVVPKKQPGAQLTALTRAWEGDPTSAFGGVLVFTDEIEDEVATWLSTRFVELVSAPGLKKGASALTILSTKRKNLKAVGIRRFNEIPEQSVVTVPGGKLYQTTDTISGEELKSVTKRAFPPGLRDLASFGISVCRSLKSNAIALVREVNGAEGEFQLVGAGQGQPNRIEALKALAVPRALGVLGATGGKISDCIMISDAFFPFRDTVDTAHEFGIAAIIQPGGSIKDSESIQACDEHGMAMAFTGTRHFRH